MTSQGTKEDPWKLKTPPNTSDYEMCRDVKDGKHVIVCTVGKTVLLYDARCIDDLHQMLKEHGDWMDLGGADEQKPAKDGTVEAWGRSEENPVGGWYGLKKGLRGRFGVYVRRCSKRSGSSSSNTIRKTIGYGQSSEKFMGAFIHIRSTKFPILPGEEEELVNKGMYGKALAVYLQAKLAERGYDSSFVVCEDWGWWVDLKGFPFAFGVCVYSHPDENGPVEFVCTDGAPGPRKWSWKKFGYIETGPFAKKLIADLVAILETDSDVEIIGISDEFPF
jgi:hypothetical protein